MAIDDPALWARIRDYRFEPNSRIAKIIRSYDREMGLPRDHMLLCIKDYRRFIYLLAEAKGQVTPSPSIARIWHYHAIDSPICYEKFCRVALGLTLMPDQSPTTTVTSPSYLQTRARYQAVFTEPPNDHIWPTARSKLRPRILVSLGAALMLWPFFVLKGRSHLTHIESVLFIASTILTAVFWIWAGVASAWTVDFQRRGKRSDYSNTSDTDFGDDGCSDGSDSDDSDGGDSDGGDGD